MPRTFAGPQCKAKAKSTGERCKQPAKPGYEVCHYHGANPKNPGGRPFRHGLYSSKASEEVKQAMAAAEDVKGLEPELAMMRGRLDIVLEKLDDGKDGVSVSALNTISFIVLRIESLVKSIQQLQLIADAGKPEGMMIVVDGMGAVLREYVPQPKWQEALDRLEYIIRGKSGDGDSGEAP